jgi:hypothetical protein
MPRAKHRKDQKKKSRARTQQIKGQQKNMQLKMQEMMMKQIEEIRAKSSGETENQSIQDAELIQPTTEL